MANSDYVTNAIGYFTPCAATADSVAHLDTLIDITGFSTDRATNPQPGDMVIIGEEVLALVSFTTGQIEVKRGVADTLPAAHAADAAVWFVEGRIGTDSREYAGNATLSVKVLPKTTSQSTPVAKSPPQQITLASRFARPYPPANLQVDGEPWFSAAPRLTAADPSVVVTWAHRNRVTQSDQLIGHTEGSVSPEVGQTYRLRFYDAADALLHTVSGITAATYTFTRELAAGPLGLGVLSDTGDVAVRIAVDSQRDGYSSWQAYDIDTLVDTTALGLSMSLTITDADDTLTASAGATHDLALTITDADDTLSATVGQDVVEHTFRYWRLRIDGWKNDGAVDAQDVRLAEWQLLTASDVRWPTSAMTGASSPSPFVATASSDDGSRPAYRVFDDNAGDSARWISSTSDTAPYLQIDLGSSVAITHMKLAPDGAVFVGGGYFITDFTLLGSSTGAFAGEETTVLMQTGLAQNDWVANTLKTFDLNAAPTWQSGSGVTLSNDGKTAISSSGWCVAPLALATPAAGLTYVEFDTSTMTDKQMFGVYASSAVSAGNYLGGGGADGVSMGDDPRLTGSTFAWVDSANWSSAGTSSIGIGVNQTTGKVNWWRNGSLQATEASFTPGTAGLHFAIGSNSARGPVTVKQASDATIPSGYTYLGA